VLVERIIVRQQAASLPLGLLSVPIFDSMQLLYASGLMNRTLTRLVCVPGGASIFPQIALQILLQCSEIDAI
jgi:hypothetical protein